MLYNCATDGKGGVAMRRSDRELGTEEEILQVLDRCDTIRVGFQGEEYPYIVPLSFGWEMAGGRLYLYVHGAKEGLRHNLLAKDFRVCVEADRNDGFVPVKDGITCLYESVIGFGRAENVVGEEAVHGLKLILQHAGYPDYPVPGYASEYTSVWKITISQMTGKRNGV